MIHNHLLTLGALITTMLMCAVCAPMPIEGETTLDIINNPLKSAAICSSIVFILLMAYDALYSIILFNRAEKILKRESQYRAENASEIKKELMSDFEIGNEDDDDIKAS